jgi:hypothetical protein
MSAALETPVESTQSVSLAPRIVASTFSIEGDKQYVIPVTFAKDVTTGLWAVTPQLPQIDVPFSTVDQIVWNLIAPSTIDPNTLRFAGLQVTFPSTQAPAPMVVISDPATSPQQCVAVWANVNSVRTGTYHYTLNIIIDGQLITHDPTVENESPTGP